MADLVGEQGKAYGVDISEAMIAEAAVRTGDWLITRSAVNRIRMLL
jgi:ubiquinone/menaquinone biosynthesis C-methylase UbiE